MKMMRVLLVGWLGLSVPAGLLMGRIMAGLRAPHEVEPARFPLAGMHDCSPEEISLQREKTPAQ